MNATHELGTTGVESVLLASVTVCRGPRRRPCFADIAGRVFRRRLGWPGTTFFFLLGLLEARRSIGPRL